MEYHSQNVFIVCLLYITILNEYHTQYINQLQTQTILANVMWFVEK